MPIDWAAKLQPPRAVTNLRHEMTGDWYRDPWGWPEYGFLLDGHEDMIASRANSNEVKRVVKIDVPKENFGIRPAVIIEPLDRVLYQCLVDSVSENLISGLSPWVHGWRLRRGNPASGEYSPNRYEWKEYRRHLKEAGLYCNCGLKTDLVSCFASIPVDRVCEDITRKAGSTGEATRLIQMLRAFDNIQGRGGLVQRSTASAVLANMYLERLRRPLGDHVDRENGGPLGSLIEMPVLRWMDDIWIFGDEEAELRSLQVDLQGAAREAGLELNLGKTKMYTEETLWEAVSKFEHSAIDAALKIDPPDMEPLEELLDQIIGLPEGSDRTTIHFALKRMRDEGVSTRLDRLIEVAPRMPHGADHLARAFRDFEMWRTLEDWFLEYADGPWNKITWSVAQLGTMFPTHTPPSDRIKQRFAKFVADRSDFLLLALAVQRLAAWDAGLARDLLHEVVQVADHPQERRAIGLAAAAAQEEKTFIRRVLSEYEDNHLTLATLEERDFEPISPAPDFGSD
jgi:hypothetical protein